MRYRDYYSGNYYSGNNRSGRGRGRRQTYRRRNAFRALIVTVATLLLVGIISFFAFLIIPAFSKVEAVEGLKISSVSENSITLSWNAVKKAKGYNIYEKDGDRYKKISSVDGEKTSYTVKKLKGLSNYSFYVKAFNKHSTGEESNTVSGSTLPPSTKITFIASQAGDSIVLEWAKVKGVGGYCVEYKKSSDKSYTSKNTLWVSGENNTIAQIGKLSSETEYKVRVCTYFGKNKVKSNPTGEKSCTVSAKADPEDDNPGPVDSTPMVALTFDDGPSFTKSSSRILDTLEKYGAKATFFMVGYNADSNPDEVKRKAELGMELGNHTWDHKHYGDSVDAEDIKSATEKIEEISGSKVTCFRSPGGETTDAIKEECKKEGLPIYYWSIDTEDWSSRDADAVYKSVMNNVSDGDIILMHEIYDSTADAVERIVPELIKKGYKLVTCRELMLAKSGVLPTPGVQYYSGYDE